MHILVPWIVPAQNRSDPIPYDLLGGRLSRGHGIGLGAIAIEREAAAIRSTVRSAIAATVATTVATTTPTAGATTTGTTTTPRTAAIPSATIAHAEFAHVPRAEATVSIGRHPERIGGLHGQDGGANDQRGGECF
uniref:Uncharacterized protein n=1 Tax=Candidatus Kentrum sp. DK TaxID=2126562 RepID=A0A450STQ3_9GAMM|nr:MAG: hypothetical protein BECKDK2373C_GA0170839_105920 [Candidatus Kentron sp. DK]